MENYNLEIFNNVNTARSNVNEVYGSDNLNKVLNEKNKFADNPEIQTKDKIYKCVYCDKLFDKNSMNNHKCTNIRKNYHKAKQLNLMQHNLNDFGGNPLKCEYCEKTFKINFDLVQHRRIHTKEKPFKCEYCEKSFRLKYGLTEHIRTHTGEKPRPCIYCGKLFKTSSGRSKHHQIHIGYRPYKCEYCHLSCMTMARLRKHTDMHIRRNHQKLKKT